MISELGNRVLSFSVLNGIYSSSGITAIAYSKEILRPKTLFIWSPNGNEKAIRKSNKRIMTI